MKSPFTLGLLIGLILFGVLLGYGVTNLPQPPLWYVEVAIAALGTPALAGFAINMSPKHCQT